jgi:hypothetical protein
MTGNLYEDANKFMHYLEGFFFRMGNVLNKICRETKSTFFLQYFFPKIVLFMR